MKIGSLEISNILSIKKARIDFDETGLVLIEGFNYDDGTANGAGKTAIMNALAFGLYGKLPRNITITNLLRYGTKKGGVIVDKIATNDGIWKVQRNRPGGVLYFKDDVQQDISQEEFESKLGLTYSQFLISMYSAQTKGEKFIDMNDRGKKEFLLQLMNLEDFSKAKTVADQDIKDINTKIHQLQLQEAALSSRIQALSEIVVDVNELNTKVAEYQSNIQEFNQKIKQQQAITRPDISQFDALEQKITKHRDIINAASIERSKLVQQFKQYGQEYNKWKSDEMPGHDVICPECAKSIREVNGELISHVDLDKIQQEKAKKANELRDKCKDIKKLIDAQDVMIAKKPEIDKLEATLRQKKIQKYADYDKAQELITNYRAYIAQQNTYINTINRQIIEQSERVKELTDSKQKLQNITTKIQNFSKELELLQTISHIYSPTGAPAYIMDSIVEDFNNATAYVLANIWPNVSYSIQTFKENKSGEIKAKFSDKLILNGKQVNIGSLSGGQHRCLSLAIDFAILDVLSNKFSIDINPVIFDEPLSGLDNANKERILEVLEKIALNRQIIIIEHSSEFKSAFSKTINVELRNGISTVSV